MGPQICCPKAPKTLAAALFEAVAVKKLELNLYTKRATACAGLSDTPSLTISFPLSAAASLAISLALLLWQPL